MALKIAAIVSTQKAILLTRNHRDFGKINPLNHGDWLP
jgi:predicted nucleic acid-binding protein